MGTSGLARPPPQPHSNWTLFSLTFSPLYLLISSYVPQVLCFVLIWFKFIWSTCSELLFSSESCRFHSSTWRGDSMLVVFLPPLLCHSVLLPQKLHFLADHDCSPTTLMKRFSYKEVLLQVISIHYGCAASIFKYKKNSQRYFSQLHSNSIWHKGMQ